MHVLDLPHKSQDYLKAIFDLHEWGDDRATLGKIAERLGQRTSTTSEGIKRLAKQGLVEHAPYADVVLTDKGQELAVQIVRRHRLVETYLFHELGYGLDELHDEAEILEHAVSDRFLERISARMGHPQRDPHGDPIPSITGAVNVPEVLSLSDATCGALYLVDRISDRDPELLRYLRDRGVLPGVTLRMRERPYPELAELEIVGGCQPSASGARVQLPIQSLSAVLCEEATDHAETQGKAASHAETQGKAVSHTETQGKAASHAETSVRRNSNADAGLEDNDGAAMPGTGVMP
ncbi:metal-dependent transcriptional regulator [Corynebacterium anserum]|uniref:Diphtheria toxin repressor n=1 Tax=Corynebacterium anserum TaxID=2684406 RepID=A0A7G7YPF4_9CORY|nr:metal-dependent transcriptional regulator [Corynebacterium anserum]